MIVCTNNNNNTLPLKNSGLIYGNKMWQNRRGPQFNTFVNQFKKTELKRCQKTKTAHRLSQNIYNKKVPQNKIIRHYNNVIKSNYLKKS